MKLMMSSLVNRSLNGPKPTIVFVSYVIEDATLTRRFVQNSAMCGHLVLFDQSTSLLSRLGMPQIGPVNIFPHELTKMRRRNPIERLGPVSHLKKPARYANGS